MKRTILALILICTFANAQEWPVLDGACPSKKEELVTIPIFDSDPPNGTPFRIALRDKQSKRVLDSFLWEGDMGDSEAHKQNKAYWSPDGQFLALYMRTGRLSATTAYFLVDRGKLVRVTAPDVWQNVLGRFKATESGPNGGISPVSWTGKNLLNVEVIGSAETTEGRIPFHYHDVMEFVGGQATVPFIYLKSVTPAPDQS
jgi:hypothetical protein